MPAGGLCLNWTKVGLKVIGVVGYNYAKNSLNWTKVGLKAAEEQAAEAVAQCLNWTKVGLKASHDKSCIFLMCTFELD